MEQRSSAHPYIPRVNNGGNFCGHYPDNPVLTPLVAFPEKFPSVLIKFSSRIADYYARPALLPSLNATNNSKKQQSSARREACVRLLKSIALNTELSTMRCGIPTPAGFAPLTLNVLAIRAGLSLSRAKRAMHCCKRAGLLSVTQITQFDDLTRKYKGVPAIKRLNDVVFSLFGLGEMLKRARKAAYKRLQVKLGKHHAKVSVKDIVGVKLLLAGSGQPKKKEKSTTLNRTELFRRLSADNPHLPIDEIFKMVKAASPGR